MQILVFGAGVIGRTYAARLAAAGHDVSILARGSAVDDLRVNGIRLTRERADDVLAFPQVVDNVGKVGHVDLAIVAVRLDQVDAALVSLSRLDADVVASFTNLPLGTEKFVRTFGADRFVSAFPGIAGRLDEEGTVHYTQVLQQPTMIGPDPRRETLVSALTSAQFPVAATKDMDAWLKTHSIFISAFESALAAVGGDARALASDGDAVRELVRAVREGFTVLRGKGVPITPTALSVIFERMPLWFATRFWRNQLAGELGTLALAPHAMATQHSELPALQQQVRTLLGGTATPRLERLYASFR